MEEASLQLTWEEFRALYPDRTREAWRKRRQQHAQAIDSRSSSEARISLEAQLARSDEDWERLFAHLESAEEARDALRMEARPELTWTAPVPGPIGIAFVSDIHAGGTGVRYDLLRRDLELIRDTPGLYAVCLGDVIDNYKPQAKSGSGMYGALFPSPKEQIMYVTLRLRWARGKWLALCGGNHDAWDGKWAGIDRLPALAADLDCPYLTEAGGTLRVTVGEQTYTLALKHQHVGQSRLNTTNSHRRLFDEFPAWDNADVLAMGHTHAPEVQQTRRKGRQVAYIRAGTYKTRDSWSENLGFEPAYGVPLVVLYPTERKLIAFDGEHFTDGVRWLAIERAAYSE